MNLVTQYIHVGLEYCLLFVLLIAESKTILKTPQQTMEYTKYTCEKLFATNDIFSTVEISNFPAMDSAMFYVSVDFRGDNISCDNPRITVYTKSACHDHCQECRFVKSEIVELATTRCRYRCACPSKQCEKVNVQLQKVSWNGEEMDDWGLCDVHVAATSDEGRLVHIL